MADPVPQSLNHAAYPTFDTGATYRFYTQVLGCPLVGAIRKEVVPSTGARTPFLHTFFALAAGECLAFFEVDGLERPTHGDAIPDWIRHIALNVESTEAVTAMRDRLQAHGVDVVGVVDHDGVWSSIYFFDPNDIRIELTHQARPLGEQDAADGLSLLQEWTRERGQSLNKSDVEAMTQTRQEAQMHAG